MHPLIPPFEPLAIPIGPITIHGFGILVAAGFIWGSQMAMRKAARDGLDPDAINRFVGWIVAGVFIGGHLGHALFYEPAHYLENPLDLLKVWSGLSSFGGFIGCTVLCAWFFPREGKPFLPYADALMYGFTLGWFFGRLGCFSAHDHPGLETQFWLGVYGMCPDLPDTVACHDMGLYEAFWSGAVCLWFMWLDKKPRPPGFFLGLIAFSYGPTRLVLDVFRAPGVDTRYLGFTPAQYGSVLLTLVGAWLLWSSRGKTPVRVLNAQALEEQAEEQAEEQPA